MKRARNEFVYLKVTNCQRIKTMEKNEKKEYEEPVIIQHENLNEVTKGYNESGQAD